MMYGKLTQLRNEFIQIRHVIPGGRVSISGKLIEVTSEYATLQVYNEDTYEDDGEYTFPLCSLINICAKHSDEQRMKAEVSYRIEQEILS